MINVSLNLPPLPLLLWETPPGLEMILGQEGVAFTKVGDPHPLAFRGGRFVVYAARKSGETVRARSRPSMSHRRPLALLQERRPFRPWSTPWRPGPREVAGLTPRAGAPPQAPSADVIASFARRHAVRRPLRAGALPLPFRSAFISGSTSKTTSSTMPDSPPLSPRSPTLPLSCDARSRQAAVLADLPGSTPNRTAISRVKPRPSQHAHLTAHRA